MSRQMRQRLAIYQTDPHTADALTTKTLNLDPRLSPPVFTLDK
jgi:hypothetical protein